MIQIMVPEFKTIQNTIGWACLGAILVWSVDQIATTALKSYYAKVDKAEQKFRNMRNANSSNMPTV